MTKLPFNLRNNIEIGNQITDGFPQITRIGLFNILESFVEKGLIEGGWRALQLELFRTCRIETLIATERYEGEVREKLYEAEWMKVFIFCERVYSKHLAAVYEYDYNGYECGIKISKDETKELFAEEIGNLLLEDNIAYEFKDGEFYRRGRAITQQSIKRVGNVLGDSRLGKVRFHYMKALNFFRDKDNPDYPNTIKESICSLEFLGDIMSGKNASKDFKAFLSKYEGNGEDKIPAPIVQSIIKIYGYRNTGEGVAHGSTKGLNVTELEAELVLNLVASFITYLYDFFSKLNSEEELPF